LQESGYRGRIKIAFDEWNLRGWHHPGFPRKSVQNYNDPKVIELVAARKNNAIASQYTMADALFSASFFNACLRHAEDVGMANIAPLVNTRGPLYVHPKGIVKRTHFHTMAMYSNQLEAKVGQLDLVSKNLKHGNQAIPILDAVATVNQSGKKWAITLINRHPDQEQSCIVMMKDQPLEGTFEACILSGDSPEAYNDITNPNRVVPMKTKMSVKNGMVKLKPHSLTILKLQRK
jgi:alpha-N-arabinofuranosidase